MEQTIDDKSGVKYPKAYLKLRQLVADKIAEAKGGAISKDVYDVCVRKSDRKTCLELLRELVPCEQQTKYSLPEWDRAVKDRPGFVHSRNKEMQSKQGCGDFTKPGTTESILAREQSIDEGDGLDAFEDMLKAI